MKSIKNLLVAGAVITAFAMSSCYKEGPKISFRSKRDRIANEWSVVEYEVDGQADDAMKNAWKSGDSMELLFVINKGPVYAFNMQYTKSYSDAHNGAVFTVNKPDQPRTYYDINNGFSDRVVFKQRLKGGGNWTFTDKFKKIRFGVIGNPDVANDDPTDIFDVDILMLKDKKFKIKFKNIDDKEHTITFEARNPNIIK
jgi:hypothetical protein